MRFSHFSVVPILSTPVSKLSSVASTGVAALRRKEGRERTFHIDGVSGGEYSGSEGKSSEGKDSKEDGGESGEPRGTSDPICCVTASLTSLMIGRESGLVHRYSLPHISLENKYQLRCRPAKLALNCNSSKMSIIDLNGLLTFFDLEARPDGAALGRAPPGEHLAYERKETWDMRWAEDNPELFCCMEKTRMYIMRGLEPEEPVLSSGYLCSFSNLQIKAILMDEIMQSPENPSPDHVLDYETKSLRDARYIANFVLFSHRAFYVHSRLCSSV